MDTLIYVSAFATFDCQVLALPLSIWAHQISSRTITDSVGTYTHLSHLSMSNIAYPPLSSALEALRSPHWAHQFYFGPEQIQRERLRHLRLPGPRSASPTILKLTCWVYTAVSSHTRDHFRAKREQLKRFEGPSPEKQGQNLDLTVLFVPSLLDSGCAGDF